MTDLDTAWTSDEETVPTLPRQCRNRSTNRRRRRSGGRVETVTDGTVAVCNSICISVQVSGVRRRLRVPEYGHEVAVEEPAVYSV